MNIGQNTATINKQRRFIILIGDNDWLNKNSSVMQSLLRQTIECYYFDQAKPNLNRNVVSVNKRNFRSLLGTEQQSIVFHAETEFNVDAFAALSGVIPGGGLLMLKLSKELLLKSLFCRRFLEYCKANRNIEIIYQQELEQELNINHILPSAKNDAFSAQANSIAKNQFVFSNFNYSAKTQDQELAISKVLQVALGRRNRPLVITADRGRGKSTALALAVVELMKTSEKKMLITAPHPDALNVFFKQIIEHLPQAELCKQRVKFKNSSVRFMPIDVLVANKQDSHLLLIDEAAGIPLPILRLLLKNYHRTVFVSTIHGYEGAGRGFSTKFLTELKQQKTQSKHIHLQQPIRWAKGDQLEQVLFDALLLNAELANLPENDNSEVSYKMYTGKELSKDNRLLNEVFALLVCAHYQTKPSDLKMLLDDPNVIILVSHKQQCVIGVALLLVEGGINESLSIQVSKSLRRLKGHFLPQSLLVHSGVKEAFKYLYLRIVRIAIHPNRQGLGLGRSLLEYCRQIAKEKKVDYIGSSFGANKQLIKFWLNNGYSCVRLGFTKDASSGEHSAMVLNAITPSAQQSLNTLLEQFYTDLPIYLCDEYQQLDPFVVQQLLLHNVLPPTEVNGFDRQSVEDFVQGYRVLSACVPAIGRWLVSILSQNRTLTKSNNPYPLLIAKFLQKHADPDLIKGFNVTGKKALLAEMKKQLAELLNNK